MPHPGKTLLVVVAAIGIACTEPSVGPPSVIRAVTAATFNAVAGSSTPGGVTVKVVDARGQSVSGSRVAFTVTGGDGTVAPHVVLSDAEGLAHAEWMIGQTAGQNTLLVSIEGIDSTTTFTATGTAGAATAVAITPHTLRLPVGATTAAVAGAVVDRFGNAIGGSPTTYTSRNTGLVTVDPTTGAVAVVGGSGTTFLVVAGAGFSDSSLVIVLKSADTPCTGITAHTSLAVGAVITTGFSDNGICVDPTATGGEYAWVPYFNSSISSALTSVTLSVFGNRAPGVLNSARRAKAPVLRDGASMATTVGATAFHARLREQEWREMPAAAANARRWYAETTRGAGGALRSAVVPLVGDKMQLNANLVDYCTNPNIRSGRVVAVTQRAVVVADDANPAGFSDAEYQAFGFAFDTLVYPVDISNFGAPTDIDNNGGRVIVFFTHAVNELGGATIGAFYGRDLLPKLGSTGACPGSNVGEIINMVVPDAEFSKAFVVRNTIGTMAHEFQHLINQGRRLYVNTSAAPTEEVWLNEGLSHVAEELMFYRVSGLEPGQNIGVEISRYAEIYLDYQYQNFGRFAYYLATPESRSPIGIDDTGADNATRGAIWSYLRYVADQRASADETSFWFKLVNSNETGVSNLNQALGSDARLLMRDWTLGVLLDDLVPGVDPRYQQPSWNYRVAVGGYPLSAPSLPTTGVATPFTLNAGGTVFARFGVGANQEVYVSAAGSGGAALPKNVLLALVRTK